MTVNNTQVLVFAVTSFPQATVVPGRWKKAEGLEKGHYGLLRGVWKRMRLQPDFSILLYSMGARLWRAVLSTATKNLDGLSTAWERKGNESQDSR